MAGLAVVAQLGAAAWGARQDDLREPVSQPRVHPGRVPGAEPAQCRPAGPEFSCGYLTVPENRDQPDGRQIQIAVARLKAAYAEPAADPVVWLTGGPGGSGLLDASGFAVAQPAVNADRDVIFVDQRGTGHSEPSLTRPEIDAFTRESTTLARWPCASWVRHLALADPARHHVASWNPPTGSSPHCWQCSTSTPAARRSSSARSNSGR